MIPCSCIKKLCFWTSRCLEKNLHSKSIRFYNCSISILSLLSKVMENVINYLIFEYSDKYKLQSTKIMYFDKIYPLWICFLMLLIYSTNLSNLNLIHSFTDDCILHDNIQYTTWPEIFQQNLNRWSMSYSVSRNPSYCGKVLCIIQCLKVWTCSFSVENVSPYL